MSLFRRVLDVLLPTACSYCRSSLNGSAIPFFCSECWSDFSLMTGPVCPRCGRLFDSPESLTHSPEHCCQNCMKTPSFFDQSLSIGYFEGALREAIHQFKYRPCRALGRPLGTWMAGSISSLQRIDVIMPIPLHLSRLHLRGFNQALLLADSLEQKFSVGCCYDNLVRSRPTRPQVELSGEDRIRNVSGAFSLVRPEDVMGRNVLLIDDVFTTGATMNECARILKLSGARQVTALTLARVV